MKQQDQIAIAGIPAHIRQLPVRLRSALMVSVGIVALASVTPASADLASTALPTGGTVVAGAAALSTSGADMTISQSSSRAVINWNSFDVGSGASVTFTQPSSTAIAVNRVTGGGAPSEIAGRITANGRVAILNANGVLFSGTANVDVGGLIATTGDIDTDAFMAGGNRLDFTGATSGDIIVNAGATISVGEAGLAAFVAPSVRNSGTITARAGSVALGSGTAFTIDLAGDRLLELSVPSTSPLVQNAGSIFAEGGRIQMSAHAAGTLVDSIVNTGVLDVTSASLDNGTIVLAAVGSSASIGGTISGSASVTADQNVTVASNISGEGDLSLAGRHVLGTGRINRTAGTLTLAVDAGGADTSGEGNFINDALGVIGTVAGGSRIDLGAGTYAAATIAKSVALHGADGATIAVATGGTGLTITASDVSVSGLTIRGPVAGDQGTIDWVATPFTSTGIVVGRNAARVTISGNDISDLRTGIRVYGEGNSGSSITGNRIENTKGAILVQYADAAAAGIGISGNREGEYGNEWGIVLNLNTAGSPLAQDAPTQIQTDIMALSNGNNAMTVLDRRYATANRSHAFVDAASTATTADDNGYGNGLGNARQALRTIQSGIDAVAAGGTVDIRDGTYSLSNTLTLDKTVSLLGESQAGTIIDSSGQNLYGIRVKADAVTLSGFTLLGSSANVGNANYGIKVEANSGDANGRNDNFTVRNVTVSGSRKNGIDLNATLGATIDGVTVTGVTAGNGIAVSDSARLTVRNTQTSGNAWGGLALYQTNNLTGGGSTQQLTNITIEGNNSFGESNGLYLQDSSTLLNPGTLTIDGFDYAVRNTGHRSDGSQFVFFRTTLVDATAYALGLAAPATSSIESYSTSGYGNVFTVVDGLSIAAANRDVRADGTINVGAGTYAAGTVVATNGVTLTGATGARIDASHNGDNGIAISADGVTVQGFEIFGQADQPYNLFDWASVITRGVTVANGADNVTVTGNDIHGVRNAILVDGRNANTAITNNRLDNTKSAISVQYTNGANLSITGNSEGANGNEWGVIGHLNGIWDGTSITASGGSLGANTPIEEQQRLLALSAANGGMATYNQAYSALNRTRAFVTVGGSPSGQGSLRDPIGTFQTGVDAVVTGGTVHVASGTYAGTVTLDTVRVLDFGTVVIGGLTLGSGASGSSIAGDITASGDILFSGATALSGNLSLAGGAVSLGAVSGNHDLTVRGTGAVTLGTTAVRSLAATGASIVATGVTTGGAQSYTGATRLSGGYTTGGGSFAVNGATTLTGATTVATAGGGASFGSLGGAFALGIDGGAGAITMGQVNGLSSLTATGATIASSGASTSGAQLYTGNALLSGSYATNGAAFTVTGASQVGGATTISSGGGAVRLGEANGAQALTIAAGAGTVALGAASLASLDVTGAAITTAGVTTTGLQRYTGATSLTGSYATGGGGFTVNGATTLAGGATIATAGGDIGLGTLSGGFALGADAGSGAITLGQVSGLTALTASGARIVSVGAATSGAQSYTGATTASGTYTSGGNLAFNGATTLAGATTVSTLGGSATFGTLGGAFALALNTGSGAITLGQVNGLTSLTATGATIASNGASTSGAQLYTGNAVLSGTYATDGAAFTVTGATQIGGATTLTSGGGAVRLGEATGAQALTIAAGAGTVTLGTARLASLDVTGAAITMAGVTTTGLQRYTGATSLTGGYATGGGGFTVNGATTLAGGATIATAGGDIGLGTLDGGFALGADAGAGAITLGQVSGLTALAATGAKISLVGAATKGAQSYAGTTTLAGSFTTDGGAFTVTGPAQIAAATTLTSAGGAVRLGETNGTQALTIAAGAGSVTLGTAKLASLDITGASIATAGVTTTGTQRYAGATGLSGTYATGGSGFTVDGSTRLLGATTIETSGGAIATAAIDGSGAGGQALTINAGTGIATLGASGSQSALGAMTITANQTILNGATYAANSLAFRGAGTAATVRLTQGSTELRTSGGGAIVIDPQLIGTANGEQNVVFTTGTGASASDGEITLGNVGSDALRIGSLTVTGGDFTAQTVKLGGDFVSKLSGNQTFSAQTLDTLGNVDASVGGNETGPVVAGGSVSITASGGGTGSITAGGPVTMAYGSDVDRTVTSEGAVTISSEGSIGGSIDAGGAVSVKTTSGAINSAIAATGPVTMATTSGSIGGSVTSAGAVSVTSDTGKVDSTISGAGLVDVSAGGGISGKITAQGDITLTSVASVQVQVDGGVITVNAPSGTVTGVFGEIKTDPDGTIVVKPTQPAGAGAIDSRKIIIDTFVAPAGGSVAANGEISLPAGLALGLIAPAGRGEGSRPPVVVNTVQRLGELLRMGYTAIIIQIDESGLDIEQELVDTGDRPARS
ncbi:MAG: filamentous hemagglutinin N-terminal domain-containing protein [Pseudomonadota bacterium]